VDVGAGAVQTLDIDLEPGATVTGVVLDEQGRPAAGAFVACRDVVAPATTRPDGTFTLSPAPRDARLAVMAWRHGTALTQTRVDTSSGGAVADVELRLRPAMIVSGRVESPDDVVPEGAIVQVADASVLSQPQSLTDGQWSYAVRFPVSADGRFQILVPPLAADEIVVRAAAPGLAPEFSRALDTGRKRHDGVRIRLGIGTSFRGRALDEAGRPVEGALVRLHPLDRGADADQAVLAAVVATTGTDGVFRVDGLRAGRAVVVVGKGEAAVSRVVRISSATDLEFVLPATTEISGVVVLEDGSPATDLLVSVQPREEPYGADAPLRPVAALPEGVRTDERGRFRIEGLPPGAFDLTVRSAPDAPHSIVTTTRTGVEAGTTGIQIAVARGGEVEGVVVDASGSPTTGAHVSINDLGGSSVAYVQTGADGRFRCTGLPGTRVRVVASVTDERGTSAEGVAEVAVGARGVRIVVDDSRIVQGRVLDPSGDPVTEGSVAAIPEDGDAGPALTWISSGGGFRLSGLEPGRYRLVHVARRGGVSVDSDWLTARGTPLIGGESVAAGSRGVELRLPAEKGTRAVIRGVVLDPDGRPVLDAMIQAEPAGGGTAERTSSDEEGAFELGPLVPGRRYRVRVWAPGYPWADLRDVEPGEEELAVALVEGLTATGRLLRADGTPIADEEFALRHVKTGAPAMARTDDDGRFEARGLLPGRHQVRVRLPGPDGDPKIVVIGELEAGATDVVVKAE
jgi:protocatechuate 3,4-dioxygenase beta subunit